MDSLTSQPCNSVNLNSLHSFNQIQLPLVSFCLVQCGCVYLQFSEMRGGGRPPPYVSIAVHKAVSMVDLSLLKGSASNILIEEHSGIQKSTICQTEMIHIISLHIQINTQLHAPEVQELTWSTGMTVLFLLFPSHYFSRLEGI